MNIHPNAPHPIHIYKLGISKDRNRLRVGDEVRARLGDKYCPAKIIEMQENKLDPLKNKYYIHFGHVAVS